MCEQEDPELRKRLFDRLFKAKVIQSNFRGELVEEIVALALESSVRKWSHCSGDWHAWDFEAGKYRIQVKQSARRQSWDDKTASAPGRHSYFYVPLNSGYYESQEGWRNINPKRRLADIYVMGWHDDASPEANHWNVASWTFFVVPTKVLNDWDDTGKKVVSIPLLEKWVNQRHVKQAKFEGLLRAIDAILSEI